jgi:WD40 repeat protein
MASVTAALASNPGLAPNSYIYKIISTAPRRDPYTYTTAADQLAIISSDDSLRFLDPSTLSLLPDGLVKNVHQSVTCLERTDDPASNIISTAGRDGLIKFWDKRSRKSAVMTIQSRM